MFFELYLWKRRKSLKNLQRLNIRYGHKHSEYVLTSRKWDNTFQEYEVDIAMLVRFAHPPAKLCRTVIQSELWIDFMRIKDLMYLCCKYSKKKQDSIGFKYSSLCKPESICLARIIGFTKKKTKTKFLLSTKLFDKNIMRVVEQREKTCIIRWKRRIDIICRHY